MSNSFAIIGGGTAGLISALILKQKFQNKNIIIIRSKKIGIVGVGESSTEHWANFLKYIDIPILNTITEASATFKSGVYFEGWAEHDFMHSLTSNRTYNDNYYYPFYAHLISNKRPQRELHSYSIWNNKIPEPDVFDNKCPFLQFHFDTHKLNDWLTRLCKKRGIRVIYDEVNTVKFENGKLKSVMCDGGEYSADFFIDASGFKRLLVKKELNSKWVSYANRFPVNSAIAFATNESDEYNLYTKSTTRDYGWSWTIPTQTRTGNGYVFSDRYINAEQAKNEMEKVYKQDLEVREFKFDPGRLEKSWISNVFAVGLSQSFVEPLEATSIGSVIQSMFCFIKHFPARDVEQCNIDINNIFENISDYVQAHYLTKKQNTSFWKEVKNDIILSDNLKDNLRKWKHRLPSQNDVYCNWGMFSAINYIPLLYGLDFFNIESIKKEYEQHCSYENENFSLENYIEKNLISHKKIIKNIINLKYQNITYN